MPVNSLANFPHVPFSNKTGPLGIDQAWFEWLLNPSFVDVNLPATGVTAGSYGSGSSVGTFTVQADGRLTVATSVPISISASQITSGTLAAGRFPALTGDITTPGGSLATTLKNTGTAGTYTKVTFDAQGRETSGGSAVLASADFANQGTTTTVLHGNAAGNPSFGKIVDGDLSLTTPALGTPSSIVLTNATGTASGLTSGNVTTNANLTGPITSTGNATAVSAPSVSLIPQIRSSGRVTGQTGAVASISTYTVGGSDGTFRVSGNINLTTATLNSFTMTCIYTDETNVSRTLTLGFTQLAGATLISTITNGTGTGPYEGITYHIRCKASTSITIGTTGTFTTVTYNAEGLIEQTS